MLEIVFENMDDLIDVAVCALGGIAIGAWLPPAGIGFTIGCVTTIPEPGDDLMDLTKCSLPNAPSTENDNLDCDDVLTDEIQDALENPWDFPWCD